MKLRTNGHINTLPPPLRPEWVAFGIWLRVALIGVALLATAVGSVLAGVHSSPKALSLFAAGSALTAVAWQRARRALARVTDATTPTEQRSPRKLSDPPKRELALM